MKFKVNTLRADTSAAARVNDALIKEGGEDLPRGSLAEGAADAIILIYSEKISAALRRAGFAIADGQTINVDTLRELVSKRAGLDLSSWEPGEVRRAVGAAVSKQVSEALGVPIDLQGDVRGQVVAAALEAVRGNKPNRMVSQALIDKLRDVAALQRAGLSYLDLRRIRNVAHNKKYRATHSQVWVIK
jgi:hypothetical protein